MQNDELERVIKTIRKQFLCGVPVNEIKLLEIVEQLDWDTQDMLMRNTVFFHANILHPVKIAYQRGFVKRLIELLESKSSEIHDCVFDGYGRLVALPDIKYSFKHYQVDDSKFITLKENNVIISEGTTGLCTWNGGMALAEWCLAHQSALKSKTILEIGSGIGLTGIVVSLYCQPSKVFLTDCHLMVLENLCHNVDLNIQLNKLSAETPLFNKVVPEEQLQKHVKFLDGSCTSIHVLNLPWELVNDKIATSLGANIVLAADVVYDSSLFPVLYLAMKTLLKVPGSEMILACTERNKKTLNAFLALLDGNPLDYKEIEPPLQKYFIWPPDPPIRLFSIKFLCKQEIL